MGLYSLYVINKSGGLIYQRDFADIVKLDTNNTLRFASIWHSLNAIAAQISPVKGCTGITHLEADSFDLHCYQSRTGTKFFVTCSSGMQAVPRLLRKVFDLYTDYVLKNPFYETEMPIRCELFDANLERLFAKQ